MERESSKYRSRQGGTEDEEAYRQEAHGDTTDCVVLQNAADTYDNINSHNDTYWIWAVPHSRLYGG